MQQRTMYEWAVIAVGMLAHVPGTDLDDLPFRLAGIALCTFGVTRLAGAFSRLPERVGGISLVGGVVLFLFALPHPHEMSRERSELVSPGSVEVFFPVDGTRLSTSVIEIDTQVKDFVVIDDLSVQDARPGYGHMHVLIDNLLVQMPGTRVAPVCISPGDHTLQVVLVAEDHFGFANEADLSDTVEVIGAPDGSCP